MMAEKVQGILFQSTLPRGERRIDAWKEPHKAGFNPRSHEESDQRQETAARQRQVSIHAPTRRATLSISQLRRCYKCFNPRSHEESDLSVSCPLCTSSCFNPRSHEESDKPSGGSSSSSSGFNPRSHEESDKGARKRSSTNRTFQSTLPRGERLLSKLV